MLQKILLEAHESEAAGNGPRRATRKTWLAAVAQNVIAAAIREQYRDCRDIRREESSPALAGAGAAPDAAAGLVDDQTSPSGHAIRQERATSVSWALAKLPPDEYNVAMLYFYERMSIPEIGEVLDRATSTVGYWLEKALTRLADELKGLDSRVGPSDPS
jgi:RNA polymerase sigma factor (sigma-70 family)